MGRPQSNSGVRSIDASGASVRCQIDAILRLQAAVWDDEARVGYIGAICLDFALGIRQYSAAENWAISRPSAASRGASTNADRTALTVGSL